MLPFSVFCSFDSGYSSRASLRSSWPNFPHFVHVQVLGRILWSVSELPQECEERVVSLGNDFRKMFFFSALLVRHWIPLRSSRQWFATALAAWCLMNTGSLGYGFPASFWPVAAGEFAGGVHGNFRLGGNSLWIMWQLSVADLPFSRHRKWYGLLEGRICGACSQSGGLAHRCTVAPS